MTTPKKQHFKRNIGIAVAVIAIMLISAVGFTNGFFTSWIDGSTPNPTPLSGVPLQTPTSNQTVQSTSTSTPTSATTQNPEQNQPVSAGSNITALSSVTNGLQLSITLTANKTTYVVGENVEITFAVTNVSNQTLNFINQNGDSNFNFQVYNSTNNAVYSWEFGAYPLDNWNVTLAPNESYTQNLIWGSDNIFPSMGEQVPSGAYYIICELGFVANYNPVQTTPPNFQTAPLNLTITNP